MICFHFTIFVVLETTQYIRVVAPMQLWFAFILLSLSYWKQRGCCGLRPCARCDLLSFYYLCRTGNNFRERAGSAKLVVICFHFTIFVVLETTHLLLIRAVHLLWFAFILLSLSYWKQPRPLPTHPGGVVICFHFTIFVVLETTGGWCAPPACGCDLLSFYYLCRTGNNEITKNRKKKCVVICFHFTIFVVLETTSSFRR